jgi:hypothetical protein
MAQCRTEWHNAEDDAEAAKVRQPQLADGDRP